MPIVTAANLKHAYGNHVILDGASLSIEPGEKIGLVGRNGQGKTTLLKAITGELKPDSGAVMVQRGARVGYLSQHPSLDPEETLRGEAERAFEELHRLHQQSHSIYEQMAHAQGADLDKLMRKQADIEAKVQTLGGYAIDHRIDAMLHGLGFTDDQFEIKVGNLSGGQKARLGLAKLLLDEPDVLLLDEPTNHLDIAGRQWLEEFLAEEYPGAVIIVSHDRWLLDRVVTRIVEVERGMVREYPGNYHAFVELRKQRMLTEGRAYEKQQDRIRQEQGFIDRYRAGQRARQAKGREARLERLKRDEGLDRPIELDVMALQLPKPPRSGDQVMVAEGVSKAYGPKKLFGDLSLTIMRGQRIGIIGPNGAGKTTLVKCLLGQEPVDSGTAREGSRLVIGYYRQSQDHLDLSLTVWEYLQRVITAIDGTARASEQQARNLAGAFLFSGSDQDKVLEMLSGGERSRAVLAGLVASANNVLVLDEPTNHLDIPSAERLESVLADRERFDGTLLLISHDRALLDAVCDELIILDGEGGTRVFPGNYSEMLRRQKEQASAQAKAAEEEQQQREREARAREKAAEKKTQRANAQSPKPARPADESAVATASPTKSPLAGVPMKQLEKRLETLQAKIKEIDDQMLKPEVYGDGRKCKELQIERAEAERDLEPLEEEWLRRSETTS